MNRILVATDFSTRSDRAVFRALLIARARGAEITLVHVVDDDQPAYLIEAQRKAASEILQQAARTIGENEGVKASGVVITGDAFAGILQAAEEHQPDLIVIGSHRRQLLDVFIGTTAERIVRRSTWPVLMANAVPAGRYERSLLAIGLDEASKSALEAAQRLGILEGTSATALHLFDAPASGMMERAMEAPEAIDHYLEVEARNAAAALASFLSEAGLQHFQPLLRPIRGSRASTILSCAAEKQGDLVVVGTSQREGLSRLLLGSVAQEVLLDAEQDVLVVPVVDQPQEDVRQ